MLTLLKFVKVLIYEKSTIYRSRRYSYKEPNDFQLDTFNKLVFYPSVFQYLGNISRDLDYELIMVTNQDGLGTENFPESDFWPTQKFLIKTFKNEGIIFKKFLLTGLFLKIMLQQENLVLLT